MNVGTRVRFNNTCVWPERIGAEGVTVAPPKLGQYPDEPGIRRGVLVVVLLDDDPLVPVDDPAPFGGRPDGWTCITNVGSLDVLPIVEEP